MAHAISFRTILFCSQLVIYSAVAAPGDSHWDRQFGLPGTTNQVFGLRFNGNNLYASGVALGANALIATNTGIDMFDGTNWTTAFGEVEGGSCVVYDLAFFRGDIYVGGAFSRANGVTAPGLVKWNGSDFVNIGFAGAALAMATDGTNLYVGGSFTNAGGVLNTNVARYDGTNWYGLGTGIGFYSSLSSYVYALELHNGLLYAGGLFTNAGGVATTNIAVWNGTAWAPLGTGAANGVNNQVYTMMFQGTDLYVGGTFTTAGGATANGIAKWNGAAWSAVGNAGCKGGVTCMGFLGTDLYVGGTLTNVDGVNARTFAKWNGTTWTTWPITDTVFQYPFNGTVNRMIVKNGSLYIGGGFNQAGDVNANHIARYDGTNFYAVGTRPANGIATPPITVSCIGQANDGIYVGGELSAAGNVFATRIARWDGTNWHPLAGGTMGGNAGANRVLAIAGRSSEVFVGGNFTNVGGINVSNIARWDGANWSNLGLGFDSGVAALAAVPGAVYAGGPFTNVWDPPSTITVNHIAKWDGAHWSALGSGVNASASVNAIAVSGANVYVGGSFTNAGGVAANRIALWNGVSWSSLGTGTANGLNGTVFAIALNGSDVYVGGSFTNAGTLVVGGIAKWDGANWSGLGSGATGPSAAEVRGLVFGSDGKLYCGGRYTNMSGVDANYIARWDGTKWQPLGSGMWADSGTIRVLGLAVRGNDIYAAGSFTAAGLADSDGIARWNETMDFTPPLKMTFSRTQKVPVNFFKSRLTCSDRATFAIDYSDDMQTWIALNTNTATMLDFTNAITSPRRVYRTRAVP